jgi:hypothetical protein
MATSISFTPIDRDVILEVTPVCEYEKSLILRFSLLSFGLNVGYLAFVLCVAKLMDGKMARL